MAKVDILDVFRSKQYDPLEFHFDNLMIPNMYYYLSQQDIDALRMIATSVEFASKIDKKYEAIDNIMRNRGFKRFSAGTNRVVYRHLEDTRFLAKIAVDKVGMQDNPLEYRNQFLLKPFVAKMFQISSCGTVGFAERVLPIKRKAEFREVASDIFDILIHKILGKYVVEDVGTQYFINWGIRYGFGPVLLDYPYVYELDGNKLYCTNIDSRTGCICNGEIDYDAGFNKLICTKCGKKYYATDLQNNDKYAKINITKGGNEMSVRIKNNGEVVYESGAVMDEFIRKPKPKTNKRRRGEIEIKVRIRCNGTPIFESSHSNDTVSEPEIVEPETIDNTDTNYTPEIDKQDNDDYAINNHDDEFEDDSDNSDTTDDIIANSDETHDNDDSPNTVEPVNDANPIFDDNKVVYTSSDNNTDSESAFARAYKSAKFMNDGTSRETRNHKNRSHKRGVVVITSKK